jgi:tRNA(Arg) A34 adenosine deaminase TadA
MIQDDHEKYIRMAMAQAENGDTPFGAVVVQHGRVVATGFNAVRSNLDVTAHSEVEAIRAAMKELGTTNLEDCILYSNAEPCPMCMATILWARIPRLVFGATSQSLSEYVPTLRPTTREMAAANNSTIQITSGILEDLCLVPFRKLNS